MLNKVNMLEIKIKTKILLILIKTKSLILFLYGFCKLMLPHKAKYKNLVAVQWQLQCDQI